MNYRKRGISQIISSILTLLVTFVLKLLGIGWINAIAIGLTLGLALLILTSSLSRRVQNFSNAIAYILIALSIALLTILGIPQIKTNFQGGEIVYGYVGGERYDLLVQDPRVKQLVKDNNLQITEGSITKKGSISQLSLVQSDRENLDFIWTGDAPIAEGEIQLIEASGTKVLENEATLSDPLVLVVDKNAAAIMSDQRFFTMVSPEETLTEFGFTYSVDTVSFADFLEGDLPWQQLGLNQYISAPGVIMSDARKSNGGVMAETLIGTIWYNMILNNLDHQSGLQSSADLVQFQPLPTVTPAVLQEKMAQLRLHSGFAESTSSKIKVQLEERGLPWALTYYSLGKKIIEDNTEFTMVALSHTVVNSNQFLCFSANGIKLLRMIQSPEFQKIAQEYGYDAPKGNWIVLRDPTFEAIRSLVGL